MCFSCVIKNKLSTGILANLPINAAAIIHFNAREGLPKRTAVARCGEEFTVRILE